MEGLRITALPAAKAGATLCATVLSGELNGVIAQHHAERHAQREAQAPGLLRRAGERDHLAGQAPRLLGGELEGLDAAAHFAGGVRGVKPASICMVRTNSSVARLHAAARRARGSRRDRTDPVRRGETRHARAPPRARPAPVRRGHVGARRKAVFVQHGEACALARSPLAIRDDAGVGLVTAIGSAFGSRGR